MERHCDLGKDHDPSDGISRSRRSNASAMRLASVSQFSVRISRHFWNSSKNLRSFEPASRRQMLLAHVP
jgi:hypothetical protein